jgi:hypothetical protein
MKDRVLRWPLNPTPWVDDEDESITAKPEEDESDDDDDEGNASPNTVEPGGKICVQKEKNYSL